jgi:hypothetical protein
MLTLHRDSIVLYIGLGLALLTYVAAAPKDIEAWGVRDWAQFGVVGLSWLIGKLQTSPLSHSQFGSAKITQDDYKV